MEKEGVVIEVPNDNGGFVNAYALDTLSRQPYLRIQPRGQGLGGAHAARAACTGAADGPRDESAHVERRQGLHRGVSCHAPRHLGKVVVGDSTAGIICTSNATLIDRTSVRLPSTRVTDDHGKDVELHPRPVDVLVVRPVRESYAHKDSQLDAAVKQLMGQISGGQRQHLSR